MRGSALLANEAALAATLFDAVWGAVGPLFTAAGKKLEADDRAGAAELVGRASVDGVFEAIQQDLLYYTNTAMLFGATMLSGSPKTTVVGLGFEQGTAEVVTGQLRAVVGQILSQIQRRALQLIADHDDGAETIHKAEAPVLRDFATFVAEDGKAFTDIASALHTTRVSAYGFTAEAAVYGVEEYQISEQMDKHICPVCAHMHGKKFSVKDARRFLNVVTRVTNPDEIKSLQPWPKQDKESLAKFVKLTPAELVAGGLHVPPYHPYCRGLLVRADSTPELGDAVVPTGPTAYEATEQEFKDLGLGITDAKLENWNANVRLPPVRVLSAITGLTQAQILDLAMKGISIKEQLAISMFTATKKATTIVVDADFYDQGPVIQVVKFQHDKGYAFLGSEEVGARKVDGLGYLKTMYLLAKDMGLRKVTLPVSGVGSSYWLSKGLYPTDAKEWDSLKASLKDRYIDAQVVYSAEAHAIIDDVLSSDNPKDALRLLELGPDVALLLDNLEWTAGIPLDDPDALALLLGD